MRLKYLSLAVGALLLSASAAAAAPAVVTNALHLRDGPSTRNRVIATMPAGATVDVIRCRFAWCLVAWARIQGYASSHYLDMGGVGYAPPRPPFYYYGSPFYEGPVFGFGFGFGPSWGWDDGWRNGWGGGWHRDRGSRWHRDRDGGRGGHWRRRH